MTGGFFKQLVRHVWFICLAVGLFVGAHAKPAAVSEPLTAAEAVRLNLKWADSSGPAAVAAHWIPGTHRLIYPKTSHGEAEIVVTDVVTGLTTHLLKGTDPLPSPNGLKLTFLREGKHTSGKSAGTQRWLANMDGTRARQITIVPGGLSSPAEEVAWSPDSSKLLYSHFTYIEKKSQQGHFERTGVSTAVQVFPQDYQSPLSWTIRVFEVSSSDDKIVLNHAGTVGTIGWLDDRAIIIDRDDGKPADVAWSQVSAIDLATMKERPVIQKLSRQPWYTPLISHTGRDMAFMASPDATSFYPEQTSLAVLNLASGRVRYVSKDPWVGYSYCWSPNDQWLVYSSGSSTHFDLYAAAEDSKVVQLTNKIGDNRSPAISDDGQYIAWTYTAPNGDKSLWLAKWSDGHLDGERELARMGVPARIDPRVSFTTLEWKSSDGLVIDGYLALPTDFERGKQYPTVVVVHGGPSGGPKPSMPEWPAGIFFTQFLAQRGYVVFQPDYRSSQRMGFDKVLAARASEQTMQSDLDDIMSGISFLEHEGISDPSRLALLGHSWGSTEVNWILTHTSKFAAAVSYEGTDFLLDWGGKDGPNTAFEWSLGASPVQNPQAFYRNSAIAFVKGVKTPTMFINTENGINSPSLEWLYSAWQTQHIDSRFVFYMNEPHVVAKPENQVDLINRILSWLKDKGV